MKRISPDVMKHLRDKHGMFICFNDVLRIELGIDRRVQMPQKETKPRRTIKFDDLDLWQSRYYQRAEWHWKSVTNAVRKANAKKTGKLYAADYTTYHVIVTRVR